MSTWGEAFQSRVEASFKRRMAGPMAHEMTYTPADGSGASTIAAVVTARSASGREFGQAGDQVVERFEGTFSADPSFTVSGETLAGIAAPALDDVLSWNGADFAIVQLEPKDLKQNAWRFVAERVAMTSRTGGDRYKRRG